MEWMNKAELEKKMKLIEEYWNSEGDCNSCGWHSAFYEIEHHVIPEIFETEDEKIFVPCCNDEGEDDHRGTYIVVKEALCEHDFPEDDEQWQNCKKCGFSRENVENRNKKIYGL